MSIIKGKVGTGETDYVNSPHILLDVNISDRTNILNSIKSRIEILIKTQDNENYKIYNSETNPDNNNRDYTPRSIDSNDVINLFCNKITSAYQYQRIEKTDFDFSILTIVPTDNIIVKKEYDNIYVYRYIRLTELIPELLQLVDDEKMKLRPAVEISYLTKSEQEYVFEAMEYNEVFPSHPQARELKKLSIEGKLTDDEIDRIMSEEKPNQKENIKFSVDKVRGYFPKEYTPTEMQNIIVKLLENYQLKWQKEKELKKYDR